MHSLDVALYLEKIGYNNHVPKEMLTLLILSGQLHDIATPLGGDITKHALFGLDEEENFTEYLSHYPEVITFISENYHISIDELQKCIQNEGVAGKLLDIADRIAYTFRDIDALAPSQIHFLG
jgi:hypothetical protein